MKRKTLSSVLAAVFSLGVVHYAAADEVQGTTAAENAERFGYPRTRTFAEGINRNDFAQLGESGIYAEQGGRLVERRKLKRDDGVDHYYGDVVVDQYRWLEEIDEIDYEYLNENDDDRVRNHVGSVWEHPDNERKLTYLSKVKNEESEVNKWVDAQNEATLNYLKKIPYYDQLKKNIDDLADFVHEDFEEKKDDVTLKYVRYPDGYYRLIRKDKDGKETVVFRERDLSEDGSVKVVERSLNENGRYFVYSTRDGSADSDSYFLYVIDTETGKQATKRIERIGSSGKVLWRDNNSFYYFGFRNGWTDIKVRHLDKQEYRDKTIAQSWKWDSAFNDFWFEADKRYLFVEGAWTGTHMLFVKDLQNGNIIQIHDQSMVEKMKRARNFSKHTFARYVHFNDKTEDLYFITTDNNEFGEIMKVNLRSPKRRELVVAAKHNHKLLEAVYQNGHFLISYATDGQNRAILTDARGKVLKDITPADGGLVSDLYSYVADKKDDSGKKSDEAGEKKDDDKNYVSFRYQNPTTPRHIHKYSLEEGRVFEVKPKDILAFDPKQYETSHLFYHSKDGTRVPITVSHKKGIKLDGSNPTILYGYGGFNADSDPRFGLKAASWMEHGGVFATAYIRGGNEYGEAWHQAGKKFNKQNVFDDFIAAGEFLIEKGYTSKQRLSVSGGSNGGLLVGAVMTQRPDLFGAAVPEVGVLDMLRYEKMPNRNTSFDSWVDEYGMTGDGKRTYENLRSYSPYHNVKDGVCYPSTLVMTSKRDDRVTPAHSYKFAAILQEKQACARPTLLWTSEKHGHGANTRAEEKQNRLHSIAFLLHEMGVKTLPEIPPRLKLPENKLP